MNRQIYACFRNDYGMEFWSTHKDLFNEYLHIYGRFMPKDEFSIVVQPITQYERFKREYFGDELSIIQQAPWHYCEDAIISTNILLTQLDLNDFIVNELYLDSIDPEIISLLPKKYQSIIRKTYWFDTILSPSESSIFNITDVRLNHLIYVMYAMYYSGKEMIDLPTEVPSLTAI